MPERKLSFSKQKRLLNASDFQYVFAKPFSSKSRYFTVLARPTQQSIARLGVIISKKRAKLAIVRNSVRRVIRESFRTHQHRLNGIDIVVIASSVVKDCDDNQLLRDALEKHWKHVANLCEKS